MIRTLANILVALLLLFTPRLAADEAAPVVVYLVDGRKLEGLLVSEDAQGIVLKMKLGAEVPIARADIKEIVRAEKPGGDKGDPGDEEGAAPAETQTVITLKDGAVIRGRSTDRGTFLEVES